MASPALVLAHGAVGPADEIAGLAAVPVVVLALFVAHLRRRHQQRAAALPPPDGRTDQR